MESAGPTTERLLRTALAEVHGQLGLVKEEFRVAEELGGRDLSELVPQRSRGVLKPPRSARFISVLAVIQKRPRTGASLCRSGPAVLFALPWNVMRMLFSFAFFFPAAVSHR